MMAPFSVGKFGRWWWLLVAAFVIALVVLAPAALFEWALSRTAQSPIRFAASDGTVWRGNGRIALRSEVAGEVIVIRWRFDPLALLRFRLGFFLEASAPALVGKTHLGLRFNDFELRDTALSVDARLLSASHIAGALIAPTGRIGLQQSAEEHFSVRPAADDQHAWRADGLMSLQAEQLVFGGILNAPVGSHELKLRGDGATINISVVRSTGLLKLEGTGAVALAPPRRVTFSGFATAADGAPAALKQLGPMMADGRQRIDLNTPW